jgi:hypothetical protein
MVFDGFRRSFDDLLARATRPEERRTVVSRMKDTLVQARVGLDELREALAVAKRRLAVEEDELATIRRRKQLAEGIDDRETVDIAAKYEAMHAERVSVLQRKVDAQVSELELAERDVAQMSAELKAVASGADARAGAPEIGLGGDAAGMGDGGAALRDEINGIDRARRQAEREADAARRLDELKRKMGK